MKALGLSIAPGSAGRSRSNSNGGIGKLPTFPSFLQTFLVTTDKGMPVPFGEAIQGTKDALTTLPGAHRYRN